MAAIADYIREIVRSVQAPAVDQGKIGDAMARCTVVQIPGQQSHAQNISAACGIARPNWSSRGLRESHAIFESAYRSQYTKPLRPHSSISLNICLGPRHNT